MESLVEYLILLGPLLAVFFLIFLFVDWLRQKNVSEKSADEESFELLPASEPVSEPSEYKNPLFYLLLVTLPLFCIFVLVQT